MAAASRPRGFWKVRRRHESPEDRANRLLAGLYDGIDFWEGWPVDDVILLDVSDMMIDRITRAKAFEIATGAIPYHIVEAWLSLHPERHHVLTTISLVTRHIIPSLEIAATFDRAGNVVEPHENFDWTDPRWNN